MTSLAGRYVGPLALEEDRGREKTHNLDYMKVSPFILFFIYIISANAGTILENWAHMFSCHAMSCQPLLLLCLLVLDCDSGV